MMVVPKLLLCRGFLVIPLNFISFLGPLWKISPIHSRRIGKNNEFYRRPSCWKPIRTREASRKRSNALVSLSISRLNIRIFRGQIKQDQVINKVYTKGTHVWANFYPPELMSNLNEIAPMLEVLGMWCLWEYMYNFRIWY